jgi:predicted dehydrogenase
VAEPRRRRRREGLTALTVRWGILSTARINQRLIEAARSSAIAEVVAVGGRDPERAETYARENGIERAYASYDDVLADPDLDAVYISLPNSLHTDWSIRALDAGKHVL